MPNRSPSPAQLPAPRVEPWAWILGAVGILAFVGFSAAQYAGHPFPAHFVAASITLAFVPVWRRVDSRWRRVGGLVQRIGEELAGEQPGS